MSLSINNVQLAGHLTRDPELRQIGADKQVASFGLAVNRRFKGGDGEMKEEVTFVDCEAWGRTAELVSQYLAKGSACYIEGRLKLDSWEDKDGGKRQRLKVVADNVQFLGKRDAGAVRGTAENPPPSHAKRNPEGAAAPAAAGKDDEPPF
jgi:single-strand DNA-binding protein